MTPRYATVLARRNLIPLALACSCAVAALGCASRPNRAPGDARTVTVASTGHEEYGMNPDYDLDEKFLVFLPLLSEREDGELEGRLARSWEQSPDRHEWTFHLRTDVRWEDGVPVTARDVKFTLALLTNPQLGIISPHMVESVTVANDSTVRVRLFNLAALRGLIGDVIFPSHLLQGLNEKDVETWDFWLQPVGDGPYRQLRRIPKTLVEFEINPGYYGTRPRIERVIVRSVGDTRFAELLSGAVDVLEGPSAAQSLLLAKDSHFGLYHPNGNSIYGIFWNDSLPLFRDPRVRRALTLAINRREAREVLALPPDFPVVDGPYTSRQLQRGDLPAPLPYDTVQARSLLEATGWFDRDGDGVRERDGRPFHFVVFVPPGRRRVVSEALAVYAQEQLRRVGVRMEIQSVQTAGAPSGHSEAIVLASGGIGWWVRTFGDSSLIGYHNPRVTELLRQLPLTMDPDEEDRILREMTGISQAEAPATFFFPSVQLVAANRRIRGLSSPWRSNPLRYMDKLWLEDPR